MTRSNEIWTYGILATLGAAWAINRYRKKQEQPTIAYPGTVFRGVQGQMVTVRLPPGSYDMFNDDGIVKMVAENSVGQFTDVVIVLGSYSTSYTLNLLFQNVATLQSHEITVVGDKIA